MSAPLDPQARARLVERVRASRSAASEAAAVPDDFWRFDRHPAYERMQIARAAAAGLGLDNPYYRLHEGIGGARAIIDGREYDNFASYNYLGLNGDARVAQAAREAIERYGTSASSSRYVAGERAVHRELEQALARLHGVDDCLAFVGGHATNVTVLGHLYGPRDLVVHDALIHNSVLEGIALAGCARRAFPHNDVAALDALLTELRPRFERVLVVVEGVYSMDGDLPDVPALAALRRRHRVHLMVDEAHSLGVLGAHGGGAREHFGLAGGDVDLWMGTLSKSLASCGGYIAGERALIENLRYGAPGFVYSVGMPPPQAAAALAALRAMQAEPWRVARLRENALHLLRALQARGIDTGGAQGHAVVPAMTGSSIDAVRWSNRLFERGVNVLPVTYPAVPEQAARLRFFVTAEHVPEALERAADELAAARAG